MVRHRLVDETWPVSTPSTSSTVPGAGYRVRRSSRIVLGGEGRRGGPWPVVAVLMVVRGLGITSGLSSSLASLSALRLALCAMAGLASRLAAAVSAVRAEDSGDDDEADALVIIILGRRASVRLVYSGHCLSPLWACRHDILQRSSRGEAR